MTDFLIPPAELRLPRNLALLDTNVLVAFVDERDNLHEQAQLFVEEEIEYALFVAPPVVVEACGLLASRKKEHIAWNLLAWVLTPGIVTLLPSIHPPSDTAAALREHAGWMRRHRVDYVDSYLMEVAHRLSCACDLRPGARIVTFDTGDYFKCSRQGYRFSLYDMKDLQPVDFEQA
ncbi:PIN domain-containing protein [Aurantimonas sp. E1-2-R+4]|uniref:PIN domain-containing protein n=1 Tax=Aurantimonas sp. E1-2-R+4 TaxID=3113714 RepID=UPI002F95177A